MLSMESDVTRQVQADLASVGWTYSATSTITLSAHEGERKSEDPRFVLESMLSALEKLPSYKYLYDYRLKKATGFVREISFWKIDLSPLLTISVKYDHALALEKGMPSQEWFSAWREMPSSQLRDVFQKINTIETLPAHVVAIIKLIIAALAGEDYRKVVYIPAVPAATAAVLAPPAVASSSAAAAGAGAAGAGAPALE